MAQNKMERDKLGRFVKGMNPWNKGEEYIKLSNRYCYKYSEDNKIIMGVKI